MEWESKTGICRRVCTLWGSWSKVQILPPPPFLYCNISIKAVVLQSIIIESISIPHTIPHTQSTFLSLKLLIWDNSNKSLFNLLLFTDHLLVIPKVIATFAQVSIPSVVLTSRNVQAKHKIHSHLQPVQSY